MSGGDFDMNYDQETTYFKAHCLSHDGNDYGSQLIIYSGRYIQDDV